MDKAKLRGIGYAFALICLLFQVEMVIFVSLDTAIRRNSEKSQLSQLQRMEENIRSEIRDVFLDLEYLAGSRDSLKFLQEYNRESRIDLGVLLTQMMNSRGRYDHMRLINPQGFEEIRINLSDRNSTYLVPEESLQDKSHRYYFLEASELNPGEIYMSAFDLNIENGSIETPFKPMIRFARKVYNKQEQWIGVALVNYMGVDLLEEVIKQSEKDNASFLLLNSDGYYLKGLEKDSEWGFMFSDKRDVGFFRDYPEEWSLIKNQGQTRILNERGFFLSTKILPFETLQNPDRFWYLVYFQEITAYRDIDRYLKLGILFSSLFLVPLFFWIGYRLGTGNYREGIYLQKIESMALYDSMTGLLNRRAVYEKASSEMQDGRSLDGGFSLGFIDVDNLKTINDTEGHEAGDLLITQAANSMKKVIRDSDIAARVGGDEFLVVFPGCSRDMALEVLKRADEDFRSQGLKYRGWEWTMSYGASEYLGQKDSLEEMIQRADKEMYRYKAKNKKSRRSGR